MTILDSTARLRSNRRMLVALFAMAIGILVGGIYDGSSVLLVIFEAVQATVWALMIGESTREIRAAGPLLIRGVR